MSFVRTLLVLVPLAAFIAIFGSSLYMMNQTSYVAEQDLLLKEHLHGLRTVMDELNTLPFVPRILRLIPGVKTLLPDVPEFTCPDPSPVELPFPWMPDFVLDHYKTVEDHFTSLQCLDAMKTWFSDYEMAVSDSPLGSLFKTAPEGINNTLPQEIDVLWIQAPWVFLALFFISLGAFLFESYGRKPAKQCVNENVSSEAPQCEEMGKQVPIEDPVVVAEAPKGVVEVLPTEDENPCLKDAKKKKRKTKKPKKNVAPKEEQEVETEVLLEDPVAVDVAEATERVAEESQTDDKDPCLKDAKKKKRKTKKNKKNVAADKDSEDDGLEKDAHLEEEDQALKSFLAIFPTSNRFEVLGEEAT